MSSRACAGATVDGKCVSASPKLDAECGRMSRRGCDKSDACMYYPPAGRCKSRETVASLPYRFPKDAALPSPWQSSPGTQRAVHDLFSRTDAPVPGHKLLVSSGNRCGQTSKLPTLAQVVVRTVAQGMAEDRIDSRGLLVWHSTGSGKTCAATAIMDAFWDTDRPLLYMSSFEALRSNPASRFHQEAGFCMSRFRGKTQEEIADAFDRRGVMFMTFAVTAHRLQLVRGSREGSRDMLRRAVIIIDEVHNIFRPLPHQKAEHDALRGMLLRRDAPEMQDVRVFILTATPGDSPEQVVALMNLVSRADIEVPDANDEASMRAFSKSVRGLVSYFNASGDLSVFPRVADTVDHAAPMGVRQFKKYLEALEAHKAQDPGKLLKAGKIQQYYRTPRKYSNALFKWEPDMQLAEFSNKLPVLLEQLHRLQPAKHYVYSQFYERFGSGGQGIRTVALALERELGYVKMTLDDAAKLAAGKLPPAKRYILAVTTELGDGKSHLNTMVQAFNDPANVDGRYVGMFLASQRFNEGIDLKAVRHIHFLEPLLSVASNKQTVGRAVRYCSHADLRRREWTVTVHHYLSTKPVDVALWNVERVREMLKAAKDPDQVKQLRKDLKDAEKFNKANAVMVDQVVRDLALAQAKVMDRVYAALKASAVDCTLLRRLHDKIEDFPIRCNPGLDFDKVRDGVRYDDPLDQVVQRGIKKRILTRAPRPA